MSLGKIGIGPSVECSPHDKALVEVGYSLTLVSSANPEGLQRAAAHPSVSALRGLVQEWPAGAGRMGRVEGREMLVDEDGPARRRRAALPWPQVLADSCR